MKHKVLIVVMAIISSPIFALTQSQQLQKELDQLQQKTKNLQIQLTQLRQEVAARPTPKATHKKKPVTKVIHTQKSLRKKPKKAEPAIHKSPVSVHVMKGHPESVEFYPAALIAEDHVVTYLAGMPVVTSPYLGARPAYDGSDYLVNISSINRDIRLMQQRRRLYRSFTAMGYEAPNLPILAVSGKVEPLATFGHDFGSPTSGDITLGSNELDLAAALNENVEAYMVLAYTNYPASFSGQRVSNTVFNLNMGFINIGNLDKTPFYFTAGQIYVPFGRYSTAMVSPTLPMLLSRIKSRPFILGYKSQGETGPFAAIFGYRGDTTQGSSGVGGLNMGYVYNTGIFNGEVGASFISSMDDAGGMQWNGSVPGTTFGGFGSFLDGSEKVKKIPAAGVHATVAVDRYSLTAEWVTSMGRFRTQDLSFNGVGAQPQAAQLELGFTFQSFDKPSSLNASGQWTKDALALNLPNYRVNAVYNISIWKDTVESLEYRHDFDYGAHTFANGAAPTGVVNQNTLGTGGGADTVLLQIGVYF